jgi:IclR family transcriptional regulator, pca regulon regulatory protein
LQLPLTGASKGLKEFSIERRDFVQSLDRGIAIIRAFGPERSSMTLSEVAQATGLTRAAARRFLLTLAKLGYVGTDRKEFWLKPRILELGQRYLAAQPWWQVAQPIVEDAARRMAESCSLCILDGPDIVYVCRVAVQRLIATNLSIGSRLPTYPTALGRVLLSQLPAEQLHDLIRSLSLQPFTPHTVTEPKKLQSRIDKARAEGYCLVNQELEVGLIGLAVPIRNAGVVAALGVSVHSARVSAKETVSRYLPVLRESANRISEGVQRRLR